MAQASCSPYPYSESSQTFSTKLDSLNASYDAANKRIVAERRLNHRVEWVFTRPVLDFGPGCEINANGPEVCDLIVKGSVAPPTSPTTSTGLSKPDDPGDDVCRVQVPGVGVPTKDTVNALKPLQRDDVVASLKAYAASLLAVTKAQDRVDFDVAADKTSAAVGSLAQSAAIASGVAAPAAPAAGAVARASTDVLLWLIGEALDYERLRELRTAAETACEPVHALAIALSFILEEQRGNELQALRTQLVWNIRTVNGLRAQSGGQDYGAAIDAAEASADSFQNIRVTDPDALAIALRDTHDKLILALRSNTGQRDALIASLSTFAKLVNQLEDAAHSVSASVQTAAGKKS